MTSVFYISFNHIRFIFLVRFSPNRYLSIETKKIKFGLITEDNIIPIDWIFKNMLLRFQLTSLMKGFFPAILPLNPSSRITPL